MMDRATLYDKIYACWLGKNIGGTLGTPVEGRMEVMDLTWYPRLDPKGVFWYNKTTCIQPLPREKKSYGGQHYEYRDPVR
jgi:hypothetical protein